MKRPRPYQETAIGETEVKFLTHRSTLAVMATGLGKTFVLTEVARRWLARGRRRRVLVMAHSRELVEQAAAELEAGTGCDVGIDMGDRRDRNRRVVVASIQSLARRLQCYDYEDEWLIVVDEAHHGLAKTYRTVFKWFGVAGAAEPGRNPESRLLGVTATPKRGDGQSLGQVFESVCIDYPIHTGVNEGWLVPIEQRSVFIRDLDFSKIDPDGEDFTDEALEQILTEEGTLHGIALKTREHARGRPTLLFCATVKHAELLAQVLNRYEPASAAFLSGASDDDVRKATICKYKQGDLRYLCNCSLFLEGFDAPHTSCVAMARPTKSVSLYAQVLGRGTRPLAGVVDGEGLDTAERRIAAIRASSKPGMTMLDFVGNAGEHRLVSSSDVLGGESTLEEIDLAQELAKARGELGADALGTLKAARALREFEAVVKEIEEEQKRKAVADRRAAIVAAGVVADEMEVDPFRGQPKRRRDGPRLEFKPIAKDPLTEKQWYYLRRLGVDADEALRFTKRQAGVVIERMMQTQGKSSR